MDRILDHILNNIRSVGRKAALSLVACQSGHGIGGRATHRFVLSLYSLNGLSPVRVSLLMRVLALGLAGGWCRCMFVIFIHFEIEKTPRAMSGSNSLSLVGSPGFSLEKELGELQ